MPHQTSSMLDHHTGQGRGWWRTLLHFGLVVLRALLCVRLAKALLLPLMDFMGVHSSEPSSSRTVSVNEETVSLVNETEEPLTSTFENEVFTCDWDVDIDRRLAKGKMKLVSDGSFTRSFEDEVSGDDDDDDDDELKQAMVESVSYLRGLEDWVRFRTPGATFHKGETSGAKTGSSDPLELHD
uniref:Uncharacterized protein n=1 Tax=Kalanchoe fedtschenkoi TaxID=63787 RepID=A0A7N0ZW32_KALFE